ncbi:MAG: carbohydrate ABC transporter permease [Ruminiclostridium sp.]
MDKVLRDKKAIIIFMTPAILFFLAIIISPIFMSSYYSLLDWDGLGKSSFIGFDNYTKLFSDAAFWLSVKNSFLIALLSLTIQLPVAMIFALILSQKVSKNGLYITIYFIPVVISTVAIGQLWSKIYNPDYGLLNTILNNLGLESLTRAWLGEQRTVLIAAFLPIVWQYIGYHMLLYYSSIKSISQDIYEAATIDGSSGINTAFKITIPLIKPMIKVSVIFSIIGSLKVFDLIYVLTEGGPSHASEVPSTLMVWTIFKRNQYGYGSSMAIFIILECFLFTYLVQKLFRVDDDI